MTKEPTKDPTDQQLTVESLPRHPAARARAEADRELVPPDADLDEEPPAVTRQPGRSGGR
ncbi:hypothetical protein [Actinoplanes subglobosus]|uniref:Uncharacterized protein n=1 Tax=Actinoplanes subglobosus TaxID=1547892 RepID=A0ABV8IYU7_9ACTN